MKETRFSLAKKLILLNLGALLFIFALVHFYVYPKIQDMFVESHKTKIRNAVEITDSLLNEYYQKFQRGEITEAEAKTRALAAVRGLRYNEVEYFWIHDLDLKMVMHPIQLKLNGADLTEKKDPDGLRIFVEMNKLVNADEKGFLKYLWPKPGSDHPVEKFSYVKLFKPWGWVSGSGVYFDEIYAMVSALQWIIYGGLAVAALLSSFAMILFTQKLMKDFSDVLQSLNAAGSEMLDLSSVLADTGNKVAEGVSSSASSITETSASMEEIGLMSQKNADNSSRAHSTADQCLSSSREGQKIVGKMIACMDEISHGNQDVLTQNKRTAEKIQQIIQLIDGIGEKTKVINDIVFQTKILAFNASVEAARAGEAGKGFSIVAEEVGNLASMSGAAALDIQASLEKSISQVREIIATNLIQSETIIANAEKKVSEGVVVVRSCERVFEEILSHVTEVAGLADQISQSCHEQKSGFDQINKAILQLNDASNVNAQASVEVSTSVERILGQSQKVQSYSNYLRLLLKGSDLA